MNRNESTFVLYQLAKSWRRALIGNNCPVANAMRDRAMAPEVGDVVSERTHRPIVPFDDLEASATIGHLRAIEKDDEGEKVYVIEDLYGERRRWVNADLFVLVPRFGAWPEPKL